MSARVATQTLLVVTAVIGLAYVVVLPPFGWSDEVPHFLRAYRVSRGQAFATNDGPLRGSVVPKGVRRLVRGSGLTTLAWEECTLEPTQLASLFAIEANLGPAGPKQFVQEFGAPYPPVASAHALPGILIARALTDHPVYWLYGARLAGLSVWLALGCLALRLAPQLRTTLLAVLLTPAAVFLAAACSIDGLLDAVGFLWTAYVLKLCAQPPTAPTRGTVGSVLGFAVLLGLLKLVYAPLALLILLVPAAHSSESPLRATWLPWVQLAVAATALGAASAAGWIAVAGGNPTDAVVFETATASVFDPLRIVKDPIGSLMAIPRTISSQWYPWLANIAWPKYTKCMPAHAVAVPLVWGAILMALAVDGNTWRPTRAQRGVGLAVFFVVMCTILLVALATWTPQDTDHALGVNARYFLPAFPGLAVALLPALPPVGARSRLLLQGGISSLLFGANVLLLVAFLRQYDWGG